MTLRHAKAAHGGRRADLGGRYYRSAWEANYARYLTWAQSRELILSWEYEPREFVFPLERGTRTYLPDFLVVQPDGSSEWREVKGWMDPRSKTRLKRMEKYFPAERVVVIGFAWFRQASRCGLAQIIPGWERVEQPAPPAPKGVKVYTPCSCGNRQCLGCERRALG